MTQWAIDPVGGLWFVTAVAVLFVAALATIAPKAKRLTPGRRRTLLILRAITAVLLLTVMLRPTLVTTITNKLPGTLLLLADRSRSMTIEDSLNNQSRWDALKQTLAASQDQLAALAESWDVKLYQFADETEETKLTEGTFDLPAESEGSQTAIGAAIEDVLDRESQQRIVAMLLLSDGAQRAFAPRDEAPQIAISRLATDRIPLYTFTFGQPALGLQSDVRVDDLLVNSVLFADAPATVDATITADGYTKEVLKVQLLWENSEGELAAVDTQQVKLVGGQRQYPITLNHTPTTPGEYKVVVEVESPPGELAVTNNRQSTFVTVQKGGISILYLVGADRVGGGPGWEPRFVRAALDSYPDQHVLFDLINYRRQQIDLTKQIEEEDYDVFLIENLDYAGLSRPTWELIADKVGQGAGLAMLGGFHSFGPGGFRNTAIDDALPIVLGRAERQNFGEAIRQDMHLPGPLRIRPVPIGAGVHPIFQSEDLADPIAAWSNLPPMDGANKFERNALKPNAAVIAEAQNPQRSPVLVVGAWGDGRTAAVAFDTTFRWHMEGAEELQRRFWRQMVLWLSRKDETAGEDVWVRLDQRRIQRGSEIQFTVGANDKEGVPVTDARFEVTVALPDGSAVPVKISKQGDDLVGNFDQTSTPGDYQISVSATTNQDRLGKSEARFTVPDRDMELDQPAAEPTLMNSLANLTADAGGAGLAPEELPDLLERLSKRTSEFEEEVSTEQSLWDRWPTLLLLTGVLCGEWYLRKRWGLV